MKKKVLFLVLAFVAVLTTGVLAVNHYQTYQNKQKEQTAQVAAQATASEVAAARATAAKDYSELVSKYNLLVVECQKGASLYDQLSQAVKARETVPACGLPIQAE